MEWRRLRRMGMGRVGMNGWTGLPQLPVRAKHSRTRSERAASPGCWLKWLNPGKTVRMFFISWNLHMPRCQGYATAAFCATPNRIRPSMSSSTGAPDPEGDGWHSIARYKAQIFQSKGVDIIGCIFIVQNAGIDWIFFAHGGVYIYFLGTFLYFRPESIIA